MFRALTRATLLVIAPPAPFGWAPGMTPLSESLRTRIRAGAGSAADRVVSVLPASGRRVVAVPVEGAARRNVSIPIQRTDLDAPRQRVRAPWQDAVPVPGVVVCTSLVPASWLRPTAAPVPTPGASGAVAPPARVPARHPDGRRDALRVSASARVRRAAMMAFGLLVSLVAVEAAARVGRR